MKTAKAEVPKPVHPQQSVAEASTRVERLEAALRVLREDDPDAEPLKVAFQNGQRFKLKCDLLESVSICVFSMSPA